MVNILQKESILLNQEADDWQHAIKLSAKPLVDQGLIDEKYIGSMIDVVNEYGSYIVLVPGVALPHSNMQEYVTKTSISFTTFKEDISFPGDKDVKVMMCLAAKDSEDHMSFLQSLTKILSSDEQIEMLAKLDDEDKIINLLKGE